MVSFRSHLDNPAVEKDYSTSGKVATHVKYAFITTLNVAAVALGVFMLISAVAAGVTLTSLVGLGIAVLAITGVAALILALWIKTCMEQRKVSQVIIHQHQDPLLVE